MSPYLFNLFINVLINELVFADKGCYIADVFMAVFLYADDIIILSPSVQGLQDMMNVCMDCRRIKLKFNSEKSLCIRLQQKEATEYFANALGTQ